MAIQMRRGLRKDFNPAKMLPGEWAVSIDASTSNQIVWMCFAPGVVKRIGTFEDLEAELDPYKEAVESYAEDAAGSARAARTSAENAESYAEQAQTDSFTATSAAETATSAAETAVTAAGTATTAAGAAEASAQTASDAEILIKQSMDEATRLIGEVETKAQAIIDAESNAEEYAEAAAGSASAASASALAASTSEDHANEYAVEAQSYAIGGTDSRVGEDQDNAKYYSEMAEEAAKRAESVSEVEIATTEKAGIVKPDGITITVDEDGTITATTHVNKWEEDESYSYGAIVSHKGKTWKKIHKGIGYPSNPAEPSSTNTSWKEITITEAFAELSNAENILTTENAIFDEGQVVGGSRQNVDQALKSIVTKVKENAENVIQINDDLTQTMADVSAHDTAIADLTVEQSTQASNISNLDIEVAKKANKTEIPTVNNGTLTIQKNGSNVATFSANQSGNATANITTPDGMISDAYQSGKTYTVGEYCIDNNQMWKCKTQCKGQTPAENSYWTKRSIGQEIKQLNTDLSVSSPSTITGTSLYKSGKVCTLKVEMNAGAFANSNFTIPSGYRPRQITFGEGWMVSSDGTKFWKVTAWVDTSGGVSINYQDNLSGGGLNGLSSDYTGYSLIVTFTYICE